VRERGRRGVAGGESEARLRMRAGSVLCNGLRSLLSLAFDRVPSLVLLIADPTYFSGRSRARSLFSANLWSFYAF